MGYSLAFTISEFTLCKYPMNKQSILDGKQTIFWRNWCIELHTSEQVANSARNLEESLSRME